MLAAGGDIDNPRPEQNVSQNYISAYRWLDLAAVAGEARAQEERDRLAIKMTAEQLAEAHQLMREMKSKQEEYHPKSTSAR